MQKHTHRQPTNSHRKLRLFFYGQPVLKIPNIYIDRLLTTTASNTKDVDEEVDNVEVQVEGGEDIFLIRRDGVLVFPAHHQLRVIHQVEGEENRAQRRVHQVQDPVVDEERDDTWKKNIFTRFGME